MSEIGEPLYKLDAISLATGISEQTLKCILHMSKIPEKKAYTAAQVLTLTKSIAPSETVKNCGSHKAIELHAALLLANVLHQQNRKKV